MRRTSARRPARDRPRRRKRKKVRRCRENSVRWTPSRRLTALWRRNLPVAANASESWKRGRKIPRRKRSRSVRRRKSPRTERRRERAGSVRKARPLPALTPRPKTGTGGDPLCLRKIFPAEKGRKGRRRADRTPGRGRRGSRTGDCRMKRSTGPRAVRSGCG